MPWKESVKAKEYNKKWRQEHPEYGKNWRETHSEKIKGYIKKGLEKRKRCYDSDPVFRAKVIGQNLENTRKRNKQLKNKILEIIRKRGSCEKCGFSDVRALEIHHHFGNSSQENYEKERKEIITGTVPFSVLCANCHRILHNPRGL